ncbi:MAG: hypothetical protein WC644_03185 [Ignavibacteria bacterium]
MANKITEVPDELYYQKYKELLRLDGHKSLVFHSIGCEERANAIAAQCDKVIAYYNNLIEFEPKVIILILNPEDWNKYTEFPVYGMPHYNDNKTLIVASENNDFWNNFIPPLDMLPVELAKLISETYTNSNGVLTMQAFFDLLVIHELGHAFYFQAGLTMQRRWMEELFTNIMLQTYIAENEPNLLPALLVFPKMVVAGGKLNFKYTSLSDFENRYEEIGKQYPQNYGWYQCRFHTSAEEIYNKGKIEPVIKLWNTLLSQKDTLNDTDFASLLAAKVNQSVADVYLKWDS